MAVRLRSGKWQRLRSLTDEQGRFRMLALDQRGSLQRAIGAVTGRKPEDVPPEALIRFKQAVTKALAPHATALLLDPEYGYPQSIEQVPPRVGLLLAAEETAHEKAGPTGQERKSHLLREWSAERTQLAGADAVKLLIYYHPDASEDVRRHQEEIVRRVGEECARTEMPFLLELVTYALDADNTDSAAFALKKPDLVARTAAEFSNPEYQVDIFKLEFPGDLRRTAEYSNGAFDGKAREAVYSLADVREFCRRLNEATHGPWVILSAGVNIEEFLVQVDLATAAGASGFLCGRAIWKDAVPLFSNTKAMETWLQSQGAFNFLRANAHAHMAMPWFEHRVFKSELSPAGKTN